MLLSDAVLLSLGQALERLDGEAISYKSSLLLCYSLSPDGGGVLAGLGGAGGSSSVPRGVGFLGLLEILGDLGDLVSRELV